MKFSEQWLRTWVDPPVSTRALVDQLTMAGLEAEAVTPAAPAFDGVVAGRVLQVDDIVGSDRLKVCSVDIGRGEPVPIVTDAPVGVGLCTAVAPAGARLAAGEVEAATLKGVTSAGRLCPAADLGLAEEDDTLVVLPDDVPPGTDLRQLLQLDDTVIEIAITPNRGDCLSIAGIARETAAVNDMPLAARPASAVAAAGRRTLSVDLDAPEACPRYVGRVVTGIDPRAQTPWWLRERLRRGGVRSVSAVVDVTNYVMLELGQPMHAFDLAALDGGIRVRYAVPGETLTLLNGQGLTLEEGTLVIADHRRPVALAGIMGGQNSAVDGSTDSLFLESAFFAPAAIAGRPRRYGLQSDSSYRFERGVDPELPAQAMERATALLIEIVGGTAGPVIEAAAAEHLPRPATIVLRDAYLARALGAILPEAQITRFLTLLGMHAVREGNGWRVTPPSHRFDIAIEADLVEEVARLHGYDRLPASRPRQGTVIKRRRPAPLNERARLVLVDRDYQEAINYSFVDPDLQALLNPGVDSPRLKNPLSEDLAQMRSNLWPGLVQSLLYNAKRQQARVRLFEVAPRYELRGGQVHEETMVAGVAYGPAFPEQWASPRRDCDFYDVKADVEAVLELWGAPDLFSVVPEVHPALHPGQSAGVYRRDPRRRLGWLGAVHPQIQRRLDLPGPRPLLFELSLDALGMPARPAFRELSKHPSVRRDIAVVVDRAVPAAALCASVRAAAGALLKDLQLFDVYEGEHLELGRKSVALGLTLQHFSRTLTDMEVEEVVEAVLSRLQTDHGATLRD